MTVMPSESEFREILQSSVTSGTAPHGRQLDRVRRIGRDAAGSGSSLDDLTDECFSAARRIWADSADGTQQAGARLLRALEDVVGAALAGYQQARQDLVLSQESARRELVDDLLSGGPHTEASLADRAARFGLDLGGAQLAIVIEAEQPFLDSSAGTRFLERELAGTFLSATRDGRLVLVASVARARTQSLVGRVLDLLPVPGTVRLTRTAPVGEWRMGVGRPRPGSEGVRASYLESRQALEIGRRLPGDGPVFHAADLLVHRMLRMESAATEDLVTSVLGPLLTARGGPATPLETLDAFFAEGGNVAATARRLHLSVRAVSYRISRIAELLGLDPADPADRFTLQTAVTGARMLDWP